MRDHGIFQRTIRRRILGAIVFVPFFVRVPLVQHRLQHLHLRCRSLKRRGFSLQRQHGAFHVDQFLPDACQRVVGGGVVLTLQGQQLLFRRAAFLFFLLKESSKSYPKKKVKIFQSINLSLNRTEEGGKY